MLDHLIKSNKKLENMLKKKKISKRDKNFIKEMINGRRESILKQLQNFKYSTQFFINLKFIVNYREKKIQTKNRSTIFL